MGWDERLFGLFYRALVGRKNEPSAEEKARAAALADHRVYLRIFAGVVGGRDIAIAASEGVGGTRAETILLPALLAFAPTREANERALRFRAAYGATTIRLGLAWAGEERLRFLATTLAAPCILAELAAELPGLPASIADLREAVLITRPRLDALTGGAACVEALAQAHLGRSWRELESLAPSQAVAWARSMSEIAPGTCEALAGAVRRAGVDLDLREGHPGVALWGQLLAPARQGPSDDEGGDVARKRPSTVREGRARDAVVRRKLAKAPLTENPITHSFEKLHTAETHTGGAKRADASDELTEHADALDELELTEVVRGGEAPGSIYRADIVLEEMSTGMAEGEAAEGLAYDEWDEAVRAYRRGWCSVREGVADEPTDAPAAAASVRAVRQRYRREISALRHEIEQLDQARRPRNREADGPEIDLDAIVDRHGALRRGCTGPDKLYVRRHRHVEDVASLILLDGSLSMDSWVQGRRVLDVACESILVLGAVLRDVDVETAVASFHSNTRRDCRFQSIKRFEEPWSVAERRMGSIEPTGYTRIGPALRHATHLLDARPARRKLLLLLSDGKPTDYDRYEGQYGVADVRQAIREASQRGITAFALAIDAEARFYLPQMFGHAGFEILPSPRALARSMGRVHRELMR